MKKINLILILFCLSLTTNAISQTNATKSLKAIKTKSNYYTSQTSETLIIPEKTLDKAWTRAQKLSGCKKTWTRPRHIVFDPMPKYVDDNRIFGLWDRGISIHPHTGEPVAYSKIYIYLTAQEADNHPKLLQDVITHEYLHEIWYRLSCADPTWRKQNSDDEEWVRTIMNDGYFKSLEQKFKSYFD